MTVQTIDSRFVTLITLNAYLNLRAEYKSSSPLLLIIKLHMSDQLMDVKFINFNTNKKPIVEILIVHARVFSRTFFSVNDFVHIKIEFWIGEIAITS